MPCYVTGSVLMGTDRICKPELEDRQTPQAGNLLTQSVKNGRWFYAVRIFRVVALTGQECHEARVLKLDLSQTLI